jgi:hypothetical protein
MLSMALSSSRRSDKHEVFYTFSRPSMGTSHSDQTCSKCSEVVRRQARAQRVIADCLLSETAREK